MIASVAPFDHARDAAWLTAYADGELDDAQAAAVDAHLPGCPQCRDELARLRRFDAVMAAVQLRDAPPEAWESFWSSFTHRAERGLGWLLFVLGATAAAGWALWLGVTALLGAHDIPGWVKAAVLIAVAGLALLVGSAVSERLHARRRTRYKDVVR